jgi:NitT/TauT family transport system permease protein
MSHRINASAGGDVVSVNGQRVAEIVAPAIVGVIFVAAWEAVVRIVHLPPYVLPGPLLVAKTLWHDGPLLLTSLLFTLRITAAALLAAVVVGGGLAILFAQSRILEISLFPYAVILQVTPIVAIAPLIIIWVNDPFVALAMCAWLAAFFPIVANTTLGLNSADRNLRDLFRLYGASRWQELVHLRIPAALPYFLAGLRISGGLALIGAVVAEFVASSGGTYTGLAARIAEAGYRLQIPRMFAALLLLSLAGIAIFAALSWLTRWLIGHWHESALPRED